MNNSRTNGAVCPFSAWANHDGAGVEQRIHRVFQGAHSQPFGRGHPDEDFRRVGRTVLRLRDVAPLTADLVQAPQERLFCLTLAALLFERGDEPAGRGAGFHEHPVAPFEFDLHGWPSPP